MRDAARTPLLGYTKGFKDCSRTRLRGTGPPLLASGSLCDAGAQFRRVLETGQALERPLRVRMMVRTALDERHREPGV